MSPANVGTCCGCSLRCSCDVDAGVVVVTACRRSDAWRGSLTPPGHQMRTVRCKLPADSMANVCLNLLCHGRHRPHGCIITHAAAASRHQLLRHERRQRPHAAHGRPHAGPDPSRGCRLTMAARAVLAVTVPAQAMHACFFPAGTHAKVLSGSWQKAEFNSDEDLLSTPCCQ